MTKHCENLQGPYHHRLAWEVSKGSDSKWKWELHSKLWSECSKITQADPKRVKSAAKVTILKNNFGYRDTSLFTHLGFGASQNMLLGLDIVQEKRTTPPSSTEDKIWKGIKTLYSWWILIHKPGDNEKGGTFWHPHLCATWNLLIALLACSILRCKWVIS